MSDYKKTPAFPSEKWDEKEALEYNHPGMTLLDYMAGQALTGALSSPETIKTIARLDENNTKFASLIAEYCYEISIAMLKEKERIESEQSK